MSSYITRGYVVVRKRLLSIFCPYVLATILYSIYADRYFNMTEILKRMLHFSAAGPLYYVAVYMQLIIVTPVLIGLLKWCHDSNRYVRYSFSLICILLICYFSVHYSNIFDIVIGGGNLLAGPWLLFWFIGMSIRSTSKERIRTIDKTIAIVSLTVAIAIWQYVFVGMEVNLSLKPIFNGTQVGMTWANTLETILIFFWFKEVFTPLGDTNSAAVGITQKKILLFTLAPMEFIGKHTLYIFLYHILFLTIYRDWINISCILLSKLICLAFIIGMPVVLEIIVDIIKLNLEKMMKNIRIDSYD